MQKEIKKIKARNHKLYNLVYGWYKKHQFQLAKNKVLKRKNKELKEKPPNNLNILMRNQVIVWLQFHSIFSLHKGHANP